MIALPSWLSLTLATLWALLSAMMLANALWAFKPPRKGMSFILGFFLSWLTLELSGFFIAGIVVAAGLAALLGIATTIPGVIALLLSLSTVIVLSIHIRDGNRAKAIMDDALGTDLPSRVSTPIPRAKLLLPFNPRRRDVRVDDDIVYAKVAGKKLELDVYQPRYPSKDGKLRPAIIQIHGGAWIIGDKEEQALPLLNHLASNGWVCFNVNYRLSPGATWPDHLIDVKRAIAWVRENAELYRIDPNFICVTGGSAGGHISAMMALTENQPQYQPGFEDADTSIAAAVPIYGVYDMTDRLQIMGKFWRYKAVEPIIMKKFFDEEPEAFSAASPIDLVHENAPPMFVIHGTRDVLAPVEYARIFVDSLRKTSTQPVKYAEIFGAQHAFEIFASPRCFHVVEGIEKYLARQWEDHLSGKLRRDIPRNRN